jgi:hypothetical protein
MIHSPYTYIQIIIDFTFTYFLHITNANHLLVNYLYHKEKQQRLVGSESGKMCMSSSRYGDSQWKESVTGMILYSSL